MSSVSSVSSSGGLWQSFKSIFDDTSDSLKSDLQSARTSAQTTLNTAQDEIEASAQQVKDDTWSLGKLIDEWI